MRIGCLNDIYLKEVTGAEKGTCALRTCSNINFTTCVAEVSATVWASTTRLDMMTCVAVVVRDEEPATGARLRGGRNQTSALCARRGGSARGGHGLYLLAGDCSVGLDLAARAHDSLAMRARDPRGLTG
eukprot:CAMPEP_0196576966 /NCGR_PEP_ID=MMETSP1081-20130531/6115_1 /TAXON_ID=36882 /ORGANISM="Pyramimonas amylifera, Strain CCMP720" /LENGTH=128 /DNA_ID=CAMNT_0041895727 /DNA_START=336 /DNA_END=722 /DNA_ORIENTATION=-